jgi:hypothetical protein
MRLKRKCCWNKLINKNAIVKGMQLSTQILVSLVLLTSSRGISGYTPEETSLLMRVKVG